MVDARRGAAAGRRDYVVATVVADEVHPAGGHAESLGWVRAHLAAGGPL